jgi:hypothetical protein
MLNPTSLHARRALSRLRERGWGRGKQPRFGFSLVCNFRGAKT